ncbi:hypothetical protein VNO77_21902 [Canavalia gladiata]|uniref:Uncharacterized protein n=1 Tax=Canavalia gladiata TaxID=3824 RepID=A0AAN9L2H6_CANGL
MQGCKLHDITIHRQPNPTPSFSKYRSQPLSVIICIFQKLLPFLILPKQGSSDPPPARAPLLGKTHHEMRVFLTRHGIQVCGARIVMMERGREFRKSEDTRGWASTCPLFRSRVYPSFHVSGPPVEGCQKELDRSLSPSEAVGYRQVGFGSDGGDFPNLN